LRKLRGAVTGDTLVIRVVSGAESRDWAFARGPAP
jgi:hypothetical protein